MRAEVCLRIEGAMLERLVQIAAQQGACLARLTRISDRVLEIETDEAGSAILIGLCRKYRLNLRILRHGGPQLIWRRLCLRRTLSAGVLSCMLLCALFLSRIWMIDIEFTGPNAALGSRAEIAAMLEDAGVYRGMISGKIDPALLELELRAGAENYSYIGVRIQGVRLLVEASPEVPAPELYAREAARDLVAARDGVIESIEVYAGTACVKAGDTVRAGQLLIRGEEDKSKEETVPVAALGQVIARSWFEGAAEGSLTESIAVRSGNADTSSRIALFEWSLPLKDAQEFAQQETETHSHAIGGIYLPLRLEQSTHYETRTIDRAIDPDQLTARLTALARAEAIAHIEGSVRSEYEIVNFWTDTSHREDSMYVRAVYEIYTDIAISRDAQIEEVYETWNTSSQ